MADTVTTKVSPHDLADILHDAWISFDTIQNVGDGVVIGGQTDQGWSAFRFALHISEASITSTTDPDEMGGFQLSDCSHTEGRLLIWGDGPPGSVEVRVTGTSTYEVDRETQRFMKKRFLGRWKPIAE
jgi:hypothetical protein